MLLNHEQAAVRARHRAFDDEQIALRISLNYLQSLHGHAGITHMTSHMRPLQHAARRRAGTNRARRARAVGLTMCLWAAGETPAFDATLEAFALGGADNIDLLADAEQTRVKFRAKLQLLQG